MVDVRKTRNRNRECDLLMSLINSMLAGEILNPGWESENPSAKREAHLVRALK